MNLKESFQPTEERNKKYVVRNILISHKWSHSDKCQYAHTKTWKTSFSRGFHLDSLLHSLIVKVQNWKNVIDQQKLQSRGKRVSEMSEIMMIDNIEQVFNSITLRVIVLLIFLAEGRRKNSPK